MLFRSTTIATITANLQADMKKNTHKNLFDDPVEDKSVINPEAYDLKKFVTVYDEQGTAVKLDVYFTKTDNNKWTMYVCSGNTYKINDPKNPDLKNPLKTIELEFDNNGNLLQPESTKIPMEAPNVNGGLFPVDLNIGGLTQLGANFTFDSTQNGYAPGTYKNFSFNEKGEIQVSYSNSQVRTIGTVGLSTVTAPDSLIPVTGTVFQAVPEAGGQTFGHPGEGTFGVLRSGMLEESNADIGDELTDMIEAQRNYTANSKVFQTGSEVMDVIVNLKR